MRPSLELLNVLVICLSVTILLKDRFEDINNNKYNSNSNNNNVGVQQQQQQQQQRQLADKNSLHTDFATDFVGSWHDCMHTVLTTYEGETSQKTTVDSIQCDKGNLGNITKVRNGIHQVLKFDMYLLNHCSFHGLGGSKGRRPCPNDTLPNRQPEETETTTTDPKKNGKVLVKYSFKGVGSFSDTDRIQFYADHSYVRNKNGEWQSNLERSKIENVDSLVCKKHSDGIVCDWHLSEYRTAAVHEDAGCKLLAVQEGGECKPGLGKTRCLNYGGTWTTECPRTKYVSDGFVYDSYGSYYLVRDAKQCKQCPAAATESP